VVDSAWHAVHTFVQKGVDGFNTSAITVTLAAGVAAKCAFGTVFARRVVDLFDIVLLERKPTVCAHGSTGKGRKVSANTTSGVPMSFRSRCPS